MSTGATFLAASAVNHSQAFASQSTQPPITVSNYLMDRTQALFDGTAKIEGTDATFVQGPIGDLNTAAFTGSGKNEIAELGLHPFMLAHANEGFRDYALLPVFLLRQFSHKSVYVRTDAGITNPEDLRGKRIGTPGYSSTSLTWIRGILEDEYGLKPAEVEWVVAVQDSSASEAGNLSDQEALLPRGITVTSGTPGLDESELLLTGEVNALFHTINARGLFAGRPAH